MSADAGNDFYPEGMEQPGDRFLRFQQAHYQKLMQDPNWAAGTPSGDSLRLLAGGSAQQAPQGQMVSGNYVPPSDVSYAQRLAQALGTGYQNNQNREAYRANDVLNGGSGQMPFGAFGGGWGRK